MIVFVYTAPAVCRLDPKGTGDYALRKTVQVYLRTASFVSVRIYGASTLPAGTKIDIARYYPEGGWIQILYEQDTKAVWWRQIEDSLILPMHIFEYPSLSEYIAGLALAG